MSQLSIDFAAPVVARARRRDPATSQEAASSMHEAAAQQTARVLQALRDMGEAGAEEIAARCGMDAYAVRKRLPEAQRAGLAEPTGDLRTTSSGRTERVWRAA